MLPGPRRGEAIALGPRAQELAYRLGAEGFLVLLDLVAHSESVPEGTVITVGYRTVARRVGLSKDTVGRRVGELVRARVLERIEDEDPQHAFRVPTYRLRLDVAGIRFLDRPDREASSQ